MSILILLCFITPSLTHRAARFQGVPGLTFDKISYERAVQYFDSIGGCVIFCLKTSGEILRKKEHNKADNLFKGCEVFETIYTGVSSKVREETTFNGFRCSIPSVG